MERSTAILLFTDVVGSTELRSRLGEEAADELRRAHDRLLGDAITTHRGRVVKNLGDGIMAGFSGASDAVAAAVAIQQAIDRRNRVAPGSAALEIRIGISAGDVTIEDGDYFGTPVIEASRLCAAATGGQILTSDVVRWLAGSVEGSTFDSLGALELKGLASPVPVCRVTWEALPQTAVPLPAFLTDIGRIFVGRGTELERLGQVWKDATAGEKRVALLAGEPGVGKTRLAAELATRVHEDGGVVLAGRCDEDLGVPYQPFVEALRHFVHHCPPAELHDRLGRYGGELARLVPELGDMVPGLPAPLRSDSDTERYRLFDGVASWLSDVSAAWPMLLVLDDLQWAAKPTLLLLRHVLRSSEPARLLIMATYRDTDIGRGHPLTDFLADLRRTGTTERLPLVGLDAPAVANFFEQAAGHHLDDEGAELARAVWAETEGNAFFVGEVLRHLSESGALERRDGRLVTTPALDDLGVPEGVREVVGRRLSRLSEPANRVLAWASVAGLEFEPLVIQAASGFDEETVVSVVEEVVAARLLVEVPGSVPRSRFSHALVRTTLYDELTAARRVVMHRKIAETIETVHAASLDDYLPALAHHWARSAAPAADTARAVDYAARAGDRALAQLAYDEATGYYGQALDLLAVASGSADEALRLELMIRLGDAQRKAGDPAYRATLLKATRLAEAHGDAESMARAALATNRGFFSVSQRVDRELVGALEDALAAFSTADSPLRARLMGNLAMELCFAPHERSHELADDALAMARRLGDPATLGQVLFWWATIHPWTDAAKMRRDAAELRRVADDLADPALTFWANFLEGIAAVLAADRRRFAAAIESMVRLGTDLSQPFLQWIAGWFRATEVRLTGRLDEAADGAQAALELGQAGGVADAFRFHGAGWFRLAYHRGQLANLSDSLERAAQRPERDAITLAAFGLMLCEEGRIGEARGVLDEIAGSGFDSVPSNFMWLYAMTMVAEVCAGVGDAEHASALYGLLEPHRGVFCIIGSAASGSVDHQLGLLATTLGDYDRADEHFTAAEAMHRSMEVPTWLARTRLEWASMLHARRRPGDDERARELLGQALATAREFGLGRVERRAVELLA